jgi:hypothetical protein
VNDFSKRLSEVLIENWFAGMKTNNTKIIVFKDKVLQYEIGNSIEKEEVLNYCRSRGIPKEQFNWTE